MLSFLLGAKKISFLKSLGTFCSPLDTNFIAEYTFTITVSHWIHQDSSDWPVVDPLPSYGRGRELPGKRHQSLIFGSYLTDVIITG
jgi:hypothetical protein